MKVVEHRRHAMRVKPKKHLSQAGVSLARRTGEDMGPFDRVLTSTVPRAFETAIAMGFAVDTRAELLSGLGEYVDAELETENAYGAGYAAFARVFAQRELTREFGQELEELLRNLAESLPENGQALVVSHGGIVELSAVACLPDANHSAWGGPAGYCEGVRLTWEDGGWRDAEILRVPQPA